jgi:hypothetical protein
MREAKAMISPATQLYPVIGLLVAPVWARVWYNPYFECVPGY